MTRTIEEQKDYIRIRIGEQLAKSMLAQNKDELSSANEHLDYLYEILSTLERR